MAKISVILGSVREGRLGFRAAKFITKELEKKGHKAILIDPKEYELPFLTNKFEYLKDEEKTENMKKLHEIFSSSEGFIILSAEYNHSVPPALKNILDYFSKEYYFKTSGMLTYSMGPFGGVRGLMNLREILSELRMPPIPTALPIPNIQNALDEEGNTTNESVLNGSKKFLDEFDWYLEAFKNQREKGVPY